MLSIFLSYELLHFSYLVVFVKFFVIHDQNLPVKLTLVYETESSKNTHLNHSPSAEFAVANFDHIKWVIVSLMITPPIPVIHI